MNFFKSFLQERNGMINFNFDFYEIVVWVATIVMCLIAVAARSLPLKARGGLGQPLHSSDSFFCIICRLEKNYRRHIFLYVFFREFA